MEKYEPVSYFGSYTFLPCLADYVEEQSHKTKIAKDVAEWLDTEPLYSIIVDHDVYWFEWVGSTYGCEKYPTQRVMAYVKGFMKKQGFRYLYD